MKRLTLLFSLFALLALLATPAQADTPNPISELTILDPYYLYENGDQLYPNQDCVAGSNLHGIIILFRPPDPAPDSYLVRWTARNNGKWRKVNGPYRVGRAGHITIRHTPIQVGKYGYFVKFIRHFFKAPAGTPMKLRIQPVTNNVRGPKTQVTINTADWINDVMGDQETACAGDA